MGGVAIKGEGGTREGHGVAYSAYVQVFFLHWLESQGSCKSIKRCLCARWFVRTENWELSPLWARPTGEWLNKSLLE
jgi:hypothetical protein